MKHSKPGAMFNAYQKKKNKLDFSYLSNRSIGKGISNVGRVIRNVGASSNRVASRGVDRGIDSIMKGGDAINARLPKYKRKKKIDIKGAVKGAQNAVGNWMKSGMPLPGAKKPPSGMSYLRGQLVKSPKLKNKRKKKTLRSPDAVVRSEQNASHQFYKKRKKL